MLMAGLMELLGWVTLQSSVVQFCILAAPSSSQISVFLLVLASTVAILCGRSLLSLMASAPVVAWLWFKQRIDDAEKKKVKDYRLGLDDAVFRRLAREEFYRNHKNFDHNCRTPQSDKEKGLIVIETFVKNSRGKEIFVKSWVPAEMQLHGLLFLCVGYGDSVTFYSEGLARALALAGYAVHGMDYPGFGMSEGLHGYIPNFDTLVDDVIEQYRIIKDRVEMRGLPCFVLGESMGGAVALRAHLKEPSMWDGAVLVAPMCKIIESMYPSWIIVQILTALAYVIPTAKLVSINNIAAVGCRDEVKRKLADLNPVAYKGKIRLGTGLQLLRTSDQIESKMHKVSLPLLVLHGTSDQVTDPSVSKLLYEKAKSTDKTLRLYEEAWHGILQGEPDARIYVVMKDIVSWLDAHSAPKTGFQPMNETELEQRVGNAVPSLINFGRFNAAT